MSSEEGQGQYDPFTCAFILLLNFGCVSDEESSLDKSTPYINKLTLNSVMRRNPSVVAAASQLSTANIVTRQTSSFETRLHLLLNERKTHGERDRN